MALEKIKKGLTVIGQGTKSSDGTDISKRIEAEKRSLERLLAVIGEKVYKEDPDTPVPGLEDEYAAIKVAYENLTRYQDELEHEKGAIHCPVCGKMASRGDRYCEKCGTCLIPGEEHKVWLL